jgi:hypothetical protein
VDGESESGDEFLHFSFTAIASNASLHESLLGMKFEATRQLVTNKQVSRKLALIAALGMMLAASFGCRTMAADDFRKNPPPGFVSVFNGKDFSGWAGPIENYEVKDGAIVCKPAKGGTIFTQQEFTNFIVRLEFKLPPGGNNGLAIRYPGEGDTAYVGMCECQVLDDNYEQATGHQIDPRQAHGSAYGLVAAKRGFQRPIGEWNFEEVTVRGSMIKVELNGTVILDADLITVTESLANRSHPGKDRPSGHFGFAGHNDPVMFRNIFIKSLN